MARWKCAHVVFSALSAAAADQSPAPPLADPGDRWSVGPLKLNGLLDAYYTHNFSHPATRINPLYNFNSRAGRADLSMLKTGVWIDPKPAGVTLDVGLGRAFDLFNSNPADPGWMKHVLQMYGSLKPLKTYGLQVDFGKFYTSAGAEVTETHLNWNYSRSLLFAAGPYYHFGARVTLPAGEHLTSSVQVVNGWNNVLDNNSGKTLGFNATVSYPGISWTHTYYVGPEKADTTQGWRNYYDSVLLFTPNQRLAAYLNFDYFTEKNLGPGSTDWIGVAGAARINLGGGFAVSPRLEQLFDKDGFVSGTPQKIHEATLTGEYKTRWGVIARLEYRHDWSSAPVYESRKDAGTFTVGLLCPIGRKR